MAEWCSPDEAFAILDAARPGASTQVDWERFLEVLDPEGNWGYYRPGIENEAEWQARSTAMSRGARTVARSIGKAFNFIFSVSWN